MVIVGFPGSWIGSCQIFVLVQATGVEGSVVAVVVVVSVAVGVSVWVGVAVGVLVFTGVKVGVGVLVGVGVFVGVGEGVGVGVLVAVDEAAIQVEGGTVTWMETLTKTVRELRDLIGPLALVSDRSRKPVIRGTIGK